MNVLIIGSGGREHALAWKIGQSPLLTQLYIAPGNAGTADLGRNLPLSVTDFQGIKEAVLEHQIGLVVVGPEVPLVEGISDFFQADPTIRHIPVIGPGREAAQLEGSKDFAKAFMKRHGIPTAAYESFTRDRLEEALSYLGNLNPPFVLKADGLAAGKGVIICNTLDEARAELRGMMLESRFGSAGDKVVIEEFLHGIEMSAFVITDGDNYLMLPSAKDYKRVGEGDTGPNTGGMGSISPVPFADERFMKIVEDRIIAPTIRGLTADGIDYRGFIFFGLMNCNGDPYVIEYNARLGDPETEAVIPRIKSDLLEILVAASEKSLAGKRLETDPRYSAAVMLVSKGYPGDYEKSQEISGLDSVQGSLVFHAGTSFRAGDQKVVTNGGRVIAVTSLADNLEEAFGISYQNAEKIEYSNKAYRKDLGRDLVKFLGRSSS
jgi:phosphoribosylamine--glycine ligase